MGNTKSMSNEENTEGLQVVRNKIRIPAVSTVLVVPVSVVR